MILSDHMEVIGVSHISNPISSGIIYYVYIHMEYRTVFVIFTLTDRVYIGDTTLHSRNKQTVYHSYNTEFMVHYDNI